MRWYRSLYSRVALGVVVFLAAMLVVQAILFVWVMTQSTRTLRGDSPARIAQRIALDLSSALAVDPNLDLAHYLRDQYAQYDHPFFIMLNDGTAITSGGPAADSELRAARAWLQRRPPPGFGRPDRRDRVEFRRPAEFGGPPFPRPGPGEGPPGFPPPSRPAPIVANGHVVGIVVVPAQVPFGFLLTRFAPTLSLVGGGVLIVATALTAALIFGPPRRRLRELEAAARRFGTGDLSARAPDKGGDEIAAVATAFNAMAADLAASDRARRQLLADVSHELNTPVTAMRGYLETLAMPELELDEATRARYLGIIGDETSRLERLIGDLLDLSRLEGGGGSLARDTVQICQVFERVAARHERACQTAGVTLQQTIEAGADVVVGDRDRLEQVIQNLVANAFRYAPSGSTIRLTAQPAANAVTIQVEDEGPGIEAEHLPHIFDRFYKADASRALRQAQDGSGLGLSIVKAIVERHGGRVSVVSRPGRTTFEIAGLQNGRS